MCSFTVVQVFRCTVVQVFRCADVQLYSGTGVQVYRCAGVQVCSFTVVQVFRCTGVQVSVACLLSPTERRTHKPDALRKHITMRRSHNSWPMCRCDCAAVQHRSNSDTQPFLFSVCSYMSGTSLMHIAFLPCALRLQREDVRSRFFRSYCATSYCLYPLLGSSYNTRHVRD